MQLKSGSRLSNCVTTPMRFLASRTCAGIGRPKASMVPESGLVWPRHMRIVVVLPAPFGPMTPRHSPASIASDRSSTTVLSPNFLHRWSMRKIGSGMGRQCAGTPGKTKGQLALTLFVETAAAACLFGLVGALFGRDGLRPIDQLDERHRRVVAD